MTAQSTSPSEKRFVLIVDDEPDIHAVTKLSLRGMKQQGRSVEFLFASSGEEAIRVVRSNPDVAVMLLDVVMETDSAGLDACRAIRGELGNKLVRILLRTGQPGAAPERQTIDEYDIDGYLAKAEISATKLYSAVRTALKAYDELVSLERHRAILASIHECAAGMHSFAPLKETLGRILSAANVVCPSPLSVLWLETFEEQGNPRRFLMELSDSADGRAAAEAVRAAVVSAGLVRAGAAPAEVHGGWVVPFAGHRELGRGFIYVQRPTPDALTAQALPLLAAHAANALYSSVAESMLSAQRGPLFDAMTI